MFFCWKLLSFLLFYNSLIILFSKESLNNLSERWIPEIKQHGDMQLLLVGTKSDFEDRRVVDYDTAKVKLLWLACYSVQIRQSLIINPASTSLQFNLIRRSTIPARNSSQIWVRISRPGSIEIHQFAMQHKSVSPKFQTQFSTNLPFRNSAQIAVLFISDSPQFFTNVQVPKSGSEFYTSSSVLRKTLFILWFECWILHKLNFL